MQLLVGIITGWILRMVYVIYKSDIDPVLDKIRELGVKIYTSIKNKIRG